MAVTIDWATKIISVPQADLTFISGTLYECDTNWLRLQLKDLEDSEAGQVFPDTHRHNTEVTVAGVTYARTVEIINGYQIEFTPDTQWTVRLAGSNNNIFDVENGVLIQNQVQVISTNSAGLVAVDSGAALWAQELETGLTAEELVRLMAAVLLGKASGGGTATRTFRDINDTKDRVVATVESDGDRTAITLDPA